MEVIFNELIKTIKKILKESKLAQKQAVVLNDKYYLGKVIEELQNNLFDYDLLLMHYQDFVEVIKELNDIPCCGQLSIPIAEMISNLYDYVKDARSIFVLDTINAKVDNNKPQPIEETVNSVYSYYCNSKREYYASLCYYEPSIDTTDLETTVFFAKETNMAFSGVTALSYTEEYLSMIISLGKQMASNPIYAFKKSIIELVVSMLEEVLGKDRLESNYFDLLSMQITDVSDVLKKNNLGKCLLMGHLNTLNKQLECESNSKLKNIVRNKFPKKGYSKETMADLIEALQFKIDEIITNCHLSDIYEYQRGFISLEGFTEKERQEIIRINKQRDIAFHLQMIIVGLRKIREQKSFQKKQEY